MLEITSDDISNLSDEDLRSLVAQLCEAELRAYGLSTSGVTWGGDQNATDGGIDVRVTVDGQAPTPGFIPRSNTGFQVKKTDFTPGLIGAEICPAGTLRPSINSLIQKSGAYVIVSSGSNTSDSALNSRIIAMREAIGDHDVEGALHLGFYDRSRLATWTRNHPGLMLWVRQRIARSVAGWRSYEAWAVSPDGVADVYLLDEKARLHIGAGDDKGVLVTAGIERMRKVLRQPRGVVRLAGLSGVGKTRLIQALFDERIGENSLDPALAIYTDMNDNPDPQPSGMVSDLIAARNRAIVVIDNCAPDLHRRLTEVSRAADSTVSVITVEYDIQEDEPEGTEVFRLEPSTPDLVAELIARRFPSISKVDVNTIADFSGGNARVALALANTLQSNETLAGLKDEELFKRLFHQRQTHDGSLLAAAQACALLYSFQGEALSGDEAELPAIGALVGVSAQDLFGKVAQLKQRDLVQRRSVWRAILPHAIANRLAEMALRTIPLEVIEAHFTTARLLKSFSRRLGYLHKSSEAVGVVEKWLGKDGLLADVANLNEFGMAMFNNIAPVSVPATLTAIERSLNGPDAKSIIDESWRRDRFASILRSIAYEADLFGRAVAALLILADAERPEARTHPVEQSLEGLFHIFLSGTHASVEQRTRIAEGLLRSDEARKQALGGKLLNSLLEAHHFSSGYSFEFGAWPRDYGYWPSLLEERVHWFVTVLKMAGPLTVTDLPVAESVKSEIASAIRGTWFLGSAVQDQFEAIAKAILTKEYWQQGWIAVRTILSYPNEKADANALDRLRAFEKTLQPKNTAERVRAVVLTATWGRLDLADSDEGKEEDEEKPLAAYERANAAAEELGKHVGEDEALLAVLLPDLTTGNGGRLSIFGKGLAAGAQHKRRVWESLIGGLAATPEGTRNGGVLGGYLLGLHALDSALCETLLDEALDHETLGPWFPALQTTVPITEAGAARLKRSVALGKAPVSQFRFLGWGRSSDAVSGVDLKQIVLAIADRPEGYPIATDILSMRLHSDRDQKHDYPLELLEAGRELLSRVEFVDRDHMHDYRLSQIASACLSGLEGAEAARKLCERFKRGLADYSVYAFNYDNLVQSIFKHQSRIALDVFFVSEPQGNGETLGVDDFDDVSDRRKNPLDLVPDKEILDWCAEDAASRYTVISRAISFFRSGKDAPLEWTPLAIALLKTAPDPLAVLKLFIARFGPRSWSGSRAAIMESRLSLLDDLGRINIPALADYAAQVRPQLVDQVAQERDWETKKDRERDERFE